VNFGTPAFFRSHSCFQNSRSTEQKTHTHFATSCPSHIVHHSNHIITYKLLIVWLNITLSRGLVVCNFLFRTRYDKIDRKSLRRSGALSSREVTSNFRRKETDRNKRRDLRKRSRRKVSVRPRLRPYIHSLTEHSALLSRVFFFPSRTKTYLRRLSR